MYEHDLTGEALREKIRSGPRSLWRYAPLLVAVAAHKAKELWLKNDTVTQAMVS